MDDSISGRNMFADPVQAISALVIPWIAACRDTHEKCRQPQNLPLPTRVLEVGDQDEPVYLRDSQRLGGPYTTLTHSWGKTQTLTTTSGTMARRQHGVSYQDLPPTFLDAVKVTRILGIKYLWIDSLCIIQNLISDWEFEDTKMLEYDLNAFVTIGAGDGETAFRAFCI